MTQSTQQVLVLLCIVLTGMWGCTTRNDSGGAIEPGVEVARTAPLSQIELEREVLFFTKESAEAIAVDPGTYLVQAHDEAHLRLEREDGYEVVIPAKPGEHEEDLSESIAATKVAAEDELHIVLFRPNGSVLDAVGTRSGIIPRGGWVQSRIYVLSDYRRAILLRQSRQTTGVKAAETPTAESTTSGNDSTAEQQVEIFDVLCPVEQLQTSIREYPSGWYPTLGPPTQDTACSISAEYQTYSQKWRIRCRYPVGGISYSPCHPQSSFDIFRDVTASECWKLNETTIRCRK